MTHTGKLTPGGRGETASPWRSLLAAGLAMVALAACDTKARDEAVQRETKTAIAQSESTAVRVAALPSTGLWDEAHLLDRLVRSGVAPRKVEDGPKGPKWMGKRPLVYSAGGGELHVWIYADSAARHAVTDSLDATTGAPAGTTAPFAAPMVFIVQNNLAAVITGGSEANQERITLALQAGLPARRP